MATGLATRCPACGTVFRVVLDQLRVSDGWVRCGRCSDVFNAAEALVDLETGAPRQVSLEPPPAAPPPAPSAPPHDDEEIVIEDFDFRDVRTAPREPAPRHAEPVEEPASSDFASTAASMHADPRDSVPVIDSTESRFAADAAEALAEADGGAAPSTDDPASPSAPSFVRAAERAQRWRQPRVRAALAVVGVLAVLGLAAQVTYEYRDLAAARYPGLRPALTQACQWVGCTVGAAHSIEGLSVESTGLVRVEKSSIYKLSVALRNRAGIELALPALDLTLTDAQGQLLARRVLRPAELGSAVTTLPAGRDLTLQATLQTRNLEPLSGYTVELFYP